MRSAFSLVRIYVDLDKIRANYRLLSITCGYSARRVLPAPSGQDVALQRLPVAWSSILPVVKADAYGHGHIPVALALKQEGATWLASGSVQEAVLLREGLDAAMPGDVTPTGIISMLGLIAPEDSSLCARHAIVPMLHCHEQLHMLESACQDQGLGPLPVAVKCNTGMSRLGFNEHELPLLRERLKKLPLRPVLAVSHLHSADEAGGLSLVREQARLFARFLGALRDDWPGLAASLGNSAGSLLPEEIDRLIGPHIRRPGLALYGCNPFHGMPNARLGQGFVPAMSASVPIIAVRTLGKGQSTGYGQTFTAKRDMPVGIMAAGYADCFTRAMSNRGVVCVAGKRAPVIGRVSMQMTAIDLSALCSDGHSRPLPRTAWILGGPYENAVTPEELAALWGSIPYEAFCLLGRNERVYGPLPEEEQICQTLVGTG